MAVKLFTLALLSLFVLSLVSVSVSADSIEWQSNCTSGKFWKNASVCFGTDCTNLTQPPITCPFGCSANGLICNTPDNTPTDYAIFLPIAMMIAAAITFFVGYNVGNSSYDDSNISGYLSFMFFGIGIILLILAFGTLGSFFTGKPDDIAALANVGFMIFVFSLILLIAIFLIKFLADHVSMINERKGKRK